jgi:hypothetical protein
VWGKPDLAPATDGEAAFATLVWGSEEEGRGKRGAGWGELS